MKKLIIFMIAIISVCAQEIKNIDDLLKVFYQKSNQVKMNKIEEEIINMEIDEVKYKYLKDFELSITPLYSVEKKENNSSVELGLEYNNFYYKRKYLGDSNFNIENKATEILGYENTLRGLFLTDYFFDREIVELKKEKTKIQNFNSISDQWKNIVDILVDFEKNKMKLERVKRNLEENKVEIMISKKLFEIGEASEYEVEFIKEQENYYRNQEERIKVDLVSLERLLGVKLGMEDIELEKFSWEGIEDKKIVKDDFASKEFSLDLKIVETEKKKNKESIWNNITLSGEYDLEDREGVVQVKFVYTPLKKDNVKESYRLEADKKKLEHEESLKNEKIEYKLLISQLETLKEEEKRLEREYRLKEKRHMYMKDLFEKGRIGYYDYLSEKKEFEEAEKSFTEAQLEYRKKIAGNIEL